MRSQSRLNGRICAAVESRLSELGAVIRQIKELWHRNAGVFRLGFRKWRIALFAGRSRLFPAHGIPSGIRGHPAIDEDHLILPGGNDPEIANPAIGSASILLMPAATLAVTRLHWFGP